MPKQKKNTPPVIGRPRKITGEAVNVAALLLAQRCDKHEVKKHLNKEFKLSYRSCETTITKARMMLIAASGKSPEDHKRDAFAFYDSIVKSGIDDRNRLKAQERIDKLFGLEAPLKLEHAGAGGGPIAIDLTQLSTEELEALDAIAQRVAGPGKTESGAGRAKA